jgi:hypothetical protein
MSRVPSCLGTGAAQREGGLLLLRKIRNALFELANRVFELLLARRMGSELELPLHLGAGETGRLELAEPFRIAACGGLTRLPLFLFTFFHALGEAGFRVDESFSCITHVWSQLID